MTIPTAPADHPIRRLDPATLAYVLESVQGVIAAEPDALLETAVGLVTEMQKYSPAASAPVAEGLDAARAGAGLDVADLTAADGAAWLVDQYIWQRPVLSGTTPPSQQQASEAIETIRRILRAASPTSEEK